MAWTQSTINQYGLNQKYNFRGFQERLEASGQYGTSIIDGCVLIGYSTNLGSCPTLWITSCLNLGKRLLPPLSCLQAIMHFWPPLRIVKGIKLRNVRKYCKWFHALLQWAVGDFWKWDEIVPNFPLWLIAIALKMCLADYWKRKKLSSPHCSLYRFAIKCWLASGWALRQLFSLMLSPEKYSLVKVSFTFMKNMHGITWESFLLWILPRNLGKMCSVLAAQMIFLVFFASS